MVTLKWLKHKIKLMQTNKHAIVSSNAQYRVALSSARRFWLTQVCTMIFPHLFVGPSDIPSVNISRKAGSGAWGISHGANDYRSSNDVSLFSSSLPVLPHEKCMYTLSKFCVDFFF